ncbi:MAG: hypothetical protein Tsb0020_36130 [Haliangiales bacterium]
MTVLIASLALGATALFPNIGAWAVQSRVLPRVAQELGRELSVGTVEVSHGQVILRDVVVSGPDDADTAPLARVAQVRVEFDYRQSLRGRVVLGAVEIEGARAHVVRHPDGRDNLRDVTARISARLAGARQQGPDDGGAPAQHSLRPTSLTMTEAAVTVDDRSAGIRIKGAPIAAEVDQGGAVTAELRDLTVTSELGPEAAIASAVLTTKLSAPVENAVLEIEDGTVRASPRLTLSSINGTVEPAGGLALDLDLEGSYGGSDKTLWRAEGRIDPAQQSASVDIAAERFTFDRLDDILRDSIVIDYEDTALGGTMHVEVAKGAEKVTFTGAFELDDLSVFHPMLATKPVTNLDLKGEVSGYFDRDSRVFELEDARMVSRGIDFEITGSAALPGGREPDSGERRDDLRVGAHLLIPPVPCQDMLDAIPVALVPYLSNFSLRGRFDTDLRLAIDWADLQATELEGSIGIDNCKAREKPHDDAIATRLAGTFTHYVEVEVEQWISFDIGYENPDFVPIWDVSPHIINAFMTTEDSRFYDHEGFIGREFQSALIKNLEAGYFRYGASSITMQTVKNVLLYREKTLARKLQELFLTWYIETVFEKDRILEIYVNAIEYGPDLYGIGPATQHYFGKHPRDIGPVEAVFLASLLPSPKRRYEQFCSDRLWRSTSSKLERILRHMHERGRLTDEEYQLAQVTPLVFDRTEAGPERECKRLVRHAIENARPTNPMLK